MDFSVSKNELKALVDMALVLREVLQMVDSDPIQKITKPHRELTRKILAFARESGLQDLIAHDEEHDTFAATEECLDSFVVPVMDEFVEGTFWDELIQRLATQDLVREVGDKIFADLADEEMFAGLERHIAKYAKEVMDHGTDRLKIVEE